MSAKKPETDTNDATADTATVVDTSARHYASQDFTDAGTSRAFEKGTTLADLDDGTLVNYAAAGLATTDKPSISA